MSPSPPEYTLLPAIHGQRLPQLEWEEEDPHTVSNFEGSRARRERSVYAGLLALAVMVYGMYLLASGPWECRQKGDTESGGRATVTLLRRMVEFEHTERRVVESPCEILGRSLRVEPSLVSLDGAQKRHVGLMRRSSGCVNFRVPPNSSTSQWSFKHSSPSSTGRRSSRTASWTRVFVFLSRRNDRNVRQDHPSDCESTKSSISISRAEYGICRLIQRDSRLESWTEFSFVNLLRLHCPRIQGRINSIFSRVSSGIMS